MFYINYSIGASSKYGEFIEYTCVSEESHTLNNIENDEQLMYIGPKLISLLLSLISDAPIFYINYSIGASPKYFLPNIWLINLIDGAPMF